MIAKPGKRSFSNCKSAALPTVLSRHCEGNTLSCNLRERLSIRQVLKPIEASFSAMLKVPAATVFSYFSAELS
jgi:hypothetical protein